MNTRKQFREYLNEQDRESRSIAGPHVDPLYRNGRFRQRTRLYGDYLYFQDREKFEVGYQEWLAAPSSGE